MAEVKNLWGAADEIIGEMPQFVTPQAGGICKTETPATEPSRHISDYLVNFLQTDCPMNRLLHALIALSMISVLVGCDSNGSGFSGTAGGAPPVGGGGGGGGAGSLGESTLIYAEAPGNTGYDDVAVNAAGTMAVFLMESDPLGTNPTGDDQLFAITFGQAVPVQITTGSGGGFRTTNDFDIDASGAAVVFVSDQDITGDNPTNTLNVFLGATDGSSITQVTSLTSGSAAEPRITGDGTMIVFTSGEDLTGGNPMNDTQIFSIAPDGSNLTQVTMGATSAESVELSAGGTQLVWVDTSDPFGTNADGSREIFTINVDGTNHMQLTVSSDDSQTPEISDDGAYVVFASAAEFTAGSNADAGLEIYVVRTDGTELVQITDADDDSGLLFNGSASALDISGNGEWITFMSYADLVGLNSNHTYTIYWANRQGTQVQQLLREETKPVGVTNRAAQTPRMTDDGTTIMFAALAAYATGAPDNGWKLFTHTRL